MKIEILHKIIDENRQNSFWYKGIGDIAKVTDNDRTIIISTCGNIRLKFTDEDSYRKNGQAVDEAFYRNCFDIDLEILEFVECNWFDFVYKNKNIKEYIEIDGDERFSYQSSVEYAKQCIVDNKFWDNL